MVLALCLTLLPASAWAAETEGTAQTPPAVGEAADPANGEEQQEDSAAKQAVATVQALIDALPAVDELDGMDDDDAMAVYEAFQAACEAYYDTLTEEQQAQLKNTEKLAALSDWFSQPEMLANSGDIFPDTVDAEGNIVRRTSWSRNGPIYKGGDGDADFTDDKFYVIEKDTSVTIQGNLTVGTEIGGLILCQGATLTVEGALICSGNYSIYGQSDGGANAGQLVVKNSLNENGGAAIRLAADATGTPTLHIDSGELEIHSGNSDKLVDGVKLSSTSHIHQGTLDGTAVSPEVWGETSLKGGTLTLAYCQHEHSADQELIPDSGATHHRHCKACGFDWASEACYFDNPNHYVPNPKDKANTHFSVCECGNVSTTPAKHEPTAIPTDDGKGHTQRCMYCFYTSTGNNPVEEHHYKANGKCENCGFKPAARDAAGNLYESVGDALKAAEDGSWVMLETHAEDGGKELREEIEFNDPGKTVELKMNGYTLTNSGNPTLTVENGTLKITGDATINQTGTFSDLAAPAVKVTGGTLRLKEGDVLNGGVSVASGTVVDLLGENLAFAKKDDTSTIVNGDVKSISENVTVVAHTHGFTLGVDGKYVCACGYVCPHNDFKDGKCTICGNGCAHTNVDENGLCRNCKTQMAVKSETGGTVTYGTDFAAAMRNATNGTKITLLADVSIAGRTGISGDNTTVTLDLNEHKITSGWLDIGNGKSPTACTLKIIGKGSYEPPMFGGIITVNVKATLDLSEWEGGTISSINISDSSDYEAETREAAVIVGSKAGTIGKLTFGNNQLGELKKTKLSGGSFNEIWTANNQPVKLGDLLVSGYALQYENGSYEQYTTTLQDASIYNVKVVKCLHPNMKPDAITGIATCEYCGKSGKFVASVDGNLYTDMNEAISYWLKNGGTLKLYADYTATDGTWSIGSGLHTINLNGHRMSVQDDSAFKPTNNMHLTVTDSKEIGQITNILLDGNQGGSFTLESGYVGEVGMTGDAVVALKGGSVDNLDVKNCSANTNLSIQGGSIGKLNIRDWADGMHVSATGGSLGAYNLPSGKILADVLDHQYYAEGTSLDKQVDTAQPVEKFVIKQAPHDFGSTSKAADVPINGSIPFMVGSPSENVGVYEVKWYRRTTSGAEHMTENRVAGVNVNVNDTLDVFCVITGVDRPGGAMQWQVAVKGYTIKVVPAKLNGDRTVITQKPNTGNTGNPADNRLVVTPFTSNTLSDVEYKFEVTYNGQPLELNKDYTIKDSSNRARNAGTHTLTIEGMGNYTGQKSVTWTLEPYELSVENFCHAQISKTYDGTDAVTDSTNGISGLDGFMLDSKNPRNPILSAVNNYNLHTSDYQLSNMKFDSAEAGDRTFTGTMTLTSDGNFVFAGGSRVMQIEYGSVSGRQFVWISSATIAAPAAKALQVANNHAATYTVDLSALLPKLESPKKYGEVTYALGTDAISFTADGYYKEGTAKIEGDKLILPIQAVKTDKTGSIGSVKVKVSTTNYYDFTLTINVNATNKIVPTGEPTLSAKTLTYGQALSAIKLSGKLHDNVNNKDVEGTFTWVDGTVKPSAGSYEAAWKFTPADGATYAETTGTVSITVNKAKLTGEPIYTRITAANKTLKDAALKPNTSWPTGTIQWVDKEGKVLPDTTEVKANTAYKWIFTPTGADAANYTKATGELTLYSVSTGGGGGGGSSSGSTVKTDTVTNPDGSVTKTETKSDGTKVETTTGKDGSVSKTTTNPNGSSVTETKDADGSTGTVKTDKHGQTSAETTLSSKAIETAKRNGEPVKAPVEVKATCDSDTAPTVKIELPRNSGDTKVEIPVSNVKPGTVAVLVHPDGTEEIVKNSLPTEDGIQLTVNGGATVKIVDNSKDFADTRNHWAKDAIDFVSARGMVNGMSATIYAPNASTTRAQLWTILARQNNADLTGGATWFENAQNWAKAKGVSDGANPNAAINRAQMVTMLWRAVGQPVAGSTANFADVSADAYYASAVAWAVENGITTGVGNGKFDPNATCTRGQIATFLWRAMAE